MNYQKIHDAIINRASGRTKKDGHYYERHHIIPDFCFIARSRKGPKGHLPGNPNAPENIVLLTPREHFIVHLLLYKILRATRYEYKAASALMWFSTKVVGEHPRGCNFSGNSKKYARYRELGLVGISQCRQGKMPVKDRVTGKIIGSVPSNHPKVQSGEWVHVTKGRKNTEEQLASCSARGCGENNNNYREMTVEYQARVKKVIAISLEADFLIVGIFKRNLKQEFSEFTRISYAWVLNHFNSWAGLVSWFNRETQASIKYKPGYRTVASRAKLANSNRRYCWLTNGSSNLRLLNTDPVPAGYYKGRTNVKDKKNTTS